MKVRNISPEKVLSADPVMRKLIGAHDPPQIGQNPVFFSLVRAVISQQLSEAAASTIFKRLCVVAEITPNKSITAGSELWCRTG
jgi:DNA-3-methyladenine glycosylase II